MVEHRRISVPTPFQVGDVNCYVLEGDSVALVDPGPDTEDAYATLENELSDMDIEVEDVDHVVVTHPHLDHFGVAERIRERSGCTVHADEAAVSILEDYDAYYHREKRYFKILLEEMGMPSQKVNVVVELPGAYTMLGPPIPSRALEPHEDGDTIDVGVELTCIETPGHAPGSTSYRRKDALYTGDHLLEEITPNPTMQLPEDGERPRTLAFYLESMKELRDLDVELCHPGHGPVVDDPEDRIQYTLDHHESRKQKLHQMVEEQPKTAYELMQEMWPEIPATEYFFGMSEVIGHMDLLEADGDVELRGDEVKTYHSS